MENMESISNLATSGLSSQFWEKMRKRNVDKKELISNNNFISWLEQFTLKYNDFTDDDWLYKPDELSEVDTRNVGKLGLFFEALSDYCHKYYINIDSNEMYEDECINIRHNGIGYQLGLVVGQGAYIYVNRKTPEDNAIEFMDIVNDIPPSDFEAKKDLLKKFEQIIAEMNAMDIPKSVILERVNK